MPANNTEIEKRLWDAADELRANSKLKSNEYSIPVLGLIFLRYADIQFSKADEKLIDSFERLYKFGTDNIPKENWQRTLTSHELKLHRKEANIAGLQLADMIAHPSRREILKENHLIIDDRDIFGDKICEILQRSKYRRDNKTGRIDGFGKKLLP